jgi:hypothetical protein
MYTLKHIKVGGTSWITLETSNFNSENFLYTEIQYKYEIQHTTWQDKQITNSTHKEHPEIQCKYEIQHTTLQDKQITNDTHQEHPLFSIFFTNIIILMYTLKHIKVGGTSWITLETSNFNSENFLYILIFILLCVVNIRKTKGGINNGQSRDTCLTCQTRNKTKTIW